jgi:probable F420-dependent oxidoreductase
MTGVGLCLPQLGPHVTTDALRVFCQHAEDLGYQSLWVQDHFLYPVNPRRPYGGRAGAPVPPQYQTVWAPLELLTAAAGWTTSVGLGTSVLVTGNHWPAPLAQRLATIDQLSEGRLLAGFGVGWNAEEHDQSGTDVATRGARMDDFIPALLACWGPDPVHHDGPFFRIEPAHVSPKPVQQPHPPLLSGMWSPAGLARTARRFDAWNPAGIPIATAAEMVDAMNQQRPAGAAPLEVYYRTFIQRPLGPPPEDDVVERLAAEVVAARAAGFTEVIIEANFWDDLTEPDVWARLPHRLEGVLKA